MAKNCMAKKKSCLFLCVKLTVCTYKIGRPKRRFHLPTLFVSGRENAVFIPPQKGPFQKEKLVFQSRIFQRRAVSFCSLFSIGNCLELGQPPFPKSIKGITSWPKNKNWLHFSGSSPQDLLLFDVFWKKLPSTKYSPQNGVPSSSSHTSWGSVFGC